MSNEKPARIELDVTADIDPYTEPERYAAAVARSERDFAKLDHELARLRVDDE
jgi:hypothetical protein